MTLDDTQRVPGVLDALAATPTVSANILDELLALEKEATKNWVYEGERYSALCVIGNKPHDDRWIAHFQPAFNGEANGQFAVAIRNAAPILIEVARAAKACLDAQYAVEMVEYFEEAVAREKAADDARDALREALDRLEGVGK